MLFLSHLISLQPNKQEGTMALAVLSWDLPLSAEQMKAYGEKAQSDWIPTVLKQPGVKEYRAYRSPTHTTPEVVSQTEFDSMNSLMQFLASDDYSRIMRELRATGVTNISAEIWDASPIAPEPLRPG
jgi:hypothetical protein